MHSMAFNGAVQKHVIVGETQEIHGEQRWGKAVRVVTQEDSFWIVNIGELSTSSLNGAPFEGELTPFLCFLKPQILFLMYD